MQVRNFFPTTIIWLAITLFVIFYLAFFGIAALEENSGIQFFADSSTYHKIFSGEIWLGDGLKSWIGVANNFLGPLLILKISGNNYYVVAAFNCIIFLYSLIKISHLLNLNSYKFLLLLLLNPITISSLMSVNKEIISFLFIACLFCFIEKKSWFNFLICFVLALMVRWQLVIVFILIFLTYSKLNFLKAHRYLFLAFIIMTASIVFYLAADLISPVSLNFSSSAAEHDGSGVWITLVELQNTGYYFVVFLFKALHLLFGLSANISKILSPDNFYNDIIQTLNAVSFVILFLILMIKGKFTMSSDIYFISVIYLIIFSITPIYSPRYLYPVYILWCILYCHREFPYFHNYKNRFSTKELVK